METWRSDDGQVEGWVSLSYVCDLGSGYPHVGPSGIPAHCYYAGPAERAVVKGGGAQQVSS